MLLVRPVTASSVNHVRAVFSPHVTVLNILYATAMLQQEVHVSSAVLVTSLDKKALYSLAL